MSTGICNRCGATELPNGWCWSCDTDMETKVDDTNFADKPLSECDRCKTAFHLFQWRTEPTTWRCVKCIWQEHEQLVGVLCVARCIHNMDFSADKLYGGTAKHCSEWNNWYDVQCEGLVTQHCNPVYTVTDYNPKTKSVKLQEPLTEHMAHEGE